MEIIKKSREDLNKKELYNMIDNPDISKMSGLAGEDVDVIDWVMYRSVSISTGEEHDVLSIVTSTGTYATNSPTFIEAFTRIVECFENDFSKIKIFENKSKRGRNFLMCKYVD